MLNQNLSCFSKQESRCFKKVAAAAGIVVLVATSGSSLFAADITAVSGFYSKSNQKIDSKTMGSKSTVNLGGRYSDDLTDTVAWIGEAEIKARSYTGAAGKITPDDGMSLFAGGGARQYFKPFADGVVPYVTGMARVVVDKTAEWTALGYVQTSTSALLYGANAGVRVGLGERFFVEIDLTIFESPLYAATKVETYVQVDKVVTSSSTESSETAFFVNSSAKLMDARLGLGIKL